MIKLLIVLCCFNFLFSCDFVDDKLIINNASSECVFISLGSKNRFAKNQLPRITNRVIEPMCKKKIYLFNSYWRKLKNQEITTNIIKVNQLISDKFQCDDSLLYYFSENNLADSINSIDSGYLFIELNQFKFINYETINYDGFSLNYGGTTEDNLN
jgi:hypothetical protein